MRLITIILCLLLTVAVQTFAHCDGLDGPVVQAAQKALESRNVDLVLFWVQKPDEPEIKRAFEHTLAVRKLGAEALQLADRFFFETLVRVHRAGEGAAYTGLKPAGRDLGPAIPAADKALRDGKVEPLMKLLRDSQEQGVQRHFEAALKKRDFAQADLEAGREFVKAYVQYIHCVEALYNQATQKVHGHYREAGTVKHHEE